MMNPEVEGSDESKIEIITISGDYVRHDETLGAAATSHVATPEDLYRIVLVGDWHAMQPIVENDPNSVRIPLNFGDTAVHVAAGVGNTTFFEELAKLISPEEWLNKSTYDNIPVQLAAINSHHRIVQLLFSHHCSHHLLHKIAYKDIQKLFFTTIENNMFDVAFKLFKYYTPELTIARWGEDGTALHMLVKKPSEVLRRELEDHDDSGGGSTVTGMQLIREIWSNVEKFEFKKIKDLTSKPFHVLFEALKSGNDELVSLLWESAQIVRSCKEYKEQGKTILHAIVLNRRFDLFYESVCSRYSRDIGDLVGAVDYYGNNVLHLAACFPLELRSISGVSAIMQMQKELAWFKKVEKLVPSELRDKINNTGKRPIDVLCDHHNRLSKDIKDSAKGIADSGMVVATLVATVAFAAALTVPGDKNSVWFIVFIVTNAIALFTSAASILSFLSNFTSSRFAETEFVISLHPSLTLGPKLLIISVAAMVVAFIAASFLIFDHRTKWVSFVLAPMGFFPLLVFILFQSKYCDNLLWSKYYRSN